MPTPMVTNVPPAGILDLALSAGDCSLILTTYDQLRLQREMLLPVRWGVAVLDEGHKIRNPDAEVKIVSRVDFLALSVCVYSLCLLLGTGGKCCCS